MELILRVDDVGRRPEDGPEHGTDVDLEYFAHWRETFGIAGHPVEYAVVPQWVSDDGLRWLAKNLSPTERVAIHGHDHAKNAKVSCGQMQDAIKRFADAGIAVRSYVPPYNHYADDDISNWAMAGGKYFFGGFYSEHHKRAEYPTRVGSAIHIPANKALYDRATPIKANLPKWKAFQCPHIVTLHVTWDDGNLLALPALRNSIAEFLITTDAIDKWLSRSTPDLRELSAPHFLAFDWILRRLPAFRRVLDFGSRYSELPSLAAMHGHNVFCYDRDPGMPKYQDGISIVNGVKLCGVSTDSDFQAVLRQIWPEVITASWAIQHNHPDRQSQIVRTMATELPAGGDLLIVGSYTGSDTFYQSNRADPQWVLCEADYQSHIISASGMKLVDRNYFHYEHGTTFGNFCTKGEANATCIHLRKE